MATIMDICGAKLLNDKNCNDFEVTFPKNGISESDFTSKIIPIIVNAASIKAKKANNGSAVSDDDRVYKTAKSTSTDNIIITVTATKSNGGKYNKAELSDYVSALKADVVQTPTQQQTPTPSIEDRTRGAVLDAFKPLFDKNEAFKNKFMPIFDAGTGSNNH